MLFFSNYVALWVLENNFKNLQINIEWFGDKSFVQRLIIEKRMVLWKKNNVICNERLLLLIIDDFKMKYLVMGKQSIQRYRYPRNLFV